MTIAVVHEASDYGIRTLSCPATELIGVGGALTMWPRSANPITIPYAWIYWLGFRELAPPPTERTEDGDD